jgi:hypothetical protein
MCSHDATKDDEVVGRLGHAPWARALELESAIKSDAPSQSVKKSSSSTNSGLRHISMACKGAGGSFSLSISDDKAFVVLTLTFPAVVIPASPAAVAVQAKPTSQDHMPCAYGLSPIISAIDDSEVRNETHANSRKIFRNVTTSLSNTRSSAKDTQSCCSPTSTHTRDPKSRAPNPQRTLKAS